MTSNATMMRATEEAMWTREQAAEWAAKQSKWPLMRRFRLEGSRAGNSRLVTKIHGDSLKSQYGGTLVELLDPPPPRRSKREEAADGLPACRWCRVLANEPCKTTTDGAKGRMPHSIRLREAELADAVADLPPCPACSAKAAEPCLTPKGNLRRAAHAARMNPDVALPECSACGAITGQRCKSPSGRARKAHAVRAAHAEGDGALTVIQGGKS